MERDFQALSNARKWPEITSLNTEGYLHWKKQIFISRPRRKKVFGTAVSYLAQPCLEGRDEAGKGRRKGEGGRVQGQRQGWNQATGFKSQLCHHSAL